MDVGAAVVEGREKEPQVRQSHDPVPDAVLEPVVLYVVGQAGFAQIYGTDAAQDVVVHLIGGVEHFHIVGSSARNVIGGMDEQNEKIFPILTRQKLSLSVCSFIYSFEFIW